MIRSLPSKDPPIAFQLLVSVLSVLSVLSVPPVSPRSFHVRRYRLFKILLRYRCSIWFERNIHRLFGCQLANSFYHFWFAFALMPIFIRTILQHRFVFLSLLVYPRLCDIMVHPLPFLQFFALLSSLLFDFSLPCPITVSQKSRQVLLTFLRPSVRRLIWEMFSYKLERDVSSSLSRMRGTEHKVSVKKARVITHRNKILHEYL
jgi:hypothetical protein